MIKLDIKYREDEEISKHADDFLQQHHPDKSIPIPIEEIIDLKFNIDIIPILGIQNLCDVEGFISPDFKAIYVDEYVYTHYEIDGRHKGIACGGIDAIHLMNKKTGFVEEIDSVLHLLKRHLPYHESDHVLNIAYNVIAGGTRLEDIELQRQNEAWLDALGAEIF